MPPPRGQVTVAMNSPGPSVPPDKCIYIMGCLCHPLLAGGDAMARPISVLEVTPEEKRELERRVAASTTLARDCLRAHIVLLRSEGVGQQEVASRLGVSAPSVSKCRAGY